MLRGSFVIRKVITSAALGGVCAALGCAQHQFDFSQASRTERFAMGSVQSQYVAVPPKVDLLWVVDRSGSMSDPQLKISQAVDGFTQKYLVPSADSASWDLRMAAITMDAYKAGDADILNSQGQVRLSFPMSMIELREASVLAGESIAKNSIISTIPRAGEVANTSWWTNMASAFKGLLSRGTVGHGTESPQMSIKRLIDHNEGGCGANPPLDTAARDCFFRRDTIWVVAILSDEEDNLCVDVSPTSTVPTWNHYRAECTNNAQAKQSLDNLWGVRNGAGTPKKLLSVAITDEVNPVASPLPNPLPYGYRVLDFSQSFIPGNQSHQDWIGSFQGDGGNLIGSSSKLENIYSNDYASILNSLGNVIVTVGTTQSEVYEFTLAHLPGTNSVTVVIVNLVTGVPSVLTADQYVLAGRNLQILKDKLPAGFVAASYQLVVNYTPSLVN